MHNLCCSGIYKTFLISLLQKWQFGISLGFASRSVSSNKRPFPPLLPYPREKLASRILAWPVPLGRPDLRRDRCWAVARNTCKIAPAEHFPQSIIHACGDSYTVFRPSWWISPCSPVGKTTLFEKRQAPERYVKRVRRARHSTRYPSHQQLRRFKLRV